jgi:hypothetical protein
VTNDIRVSQLATAALKCRAHFPNLKSILYLCDYGFGKASGELLTVEIFAVLFYKSIDGKNAVHSVSAVPIHESVDYGAF